MSKGNGIRDVPDTRNKCKSPEVEACLAHMTHLSVVVYYFK